MFLTAGKKWLNFALFSFWIVSLLGLLIRYKIAFPFPFFTHKNLLHAHSHFAFSAWVTQALMILIAGEITKENQTISFTKFIPVFRFNGFLAFGMLFSFLYQGYGPISIVFSTLSIAISFWFAFLVWQSVKSVSLKENTWLNWLLAANFFNILSTAGTLFLAFSMATKAMNPSSYLASVYWYLHFQYNGWFTFAILGLLAKFLLHKGIPSNSINLAFKLFFFSCFFTYFLSVSWFFQAVWVYWLSGLSAFLQLAAWLIILLAIRSCSFQIGFPSVWPKRLLLLSLMAFSFKFVLQLGLSFPFLSQLAFGSRPIVIGYLHLVFLACVSLFLLAYFYRFNEKSISTIGLVLFLIGLIFNELVLAFQGLAGIFYWYFPYANPMLVFCSFLMALGLGLQVWKVYSLDRQRSAW
ncbi:MAG: hypothetical protein K1X82_08400 [Bacteroidia bacterium]|nr:hypothetical protein [Bacteroidia bacterium]